MGWVVFVRLETCAFRVPNENRHCGRKEGAKAPRVMCGGPRAGLSYGVQEASGVPIQLKPGPTEGTTQSSTVEPTAVELVLKHPLRGRARPPCSQCGHRHSLASLIVGIAISERGRRAPRQHRKALKGTGPVLTAVSRALYGRGGGDRTQRQHSEDKPHETTPGNFLFWAQPGFGELDQVDVVRFTSAREPRPTPRGPPSTPKKTLENQASLAAGHFKRTRGVTRDTGVWKCGGSMFGSLVIVECGRFNVLPSEVVS